MTKKTINKNNEPGELFLIGGLGLLEAYFREKISFELAMDGALVPNASGPFIDAGNARVRKLMGDLEKLLRQYKKDPPTQTGRRE